MKVFIETVVNKLTNLYQLYENYIWKYSHEKIKINVLIQDNMICYYLYNQTEIIDEFILTFNHKEYELYKYISIRLMLNLLGNVLIYNDGYTFYNDTHKSYLNLVIGDDIIFENALYIVKNQENEIFNDDNKYIEKIYKKVPSKIYPYIFLENLEKRIDISKKILR